MTRPYLHSDWPGDEFDAHWFLSMACGWRVRMDTEPERGEKPRLTLTHPSGLEVRYVGEDCDVFGNLEHVTSEEQRAVDEIVSEFFDCAWFAGEAEWFATGRR